MSSELISMWSMYASWVSAFATILAVVAAFLIPKLQLININKKAELDAQKLVLSQLLIVKENLTQHTHALKLNTIMDNSIINISYLSDEVLSAIQIDKLTLLFKLRNGIDSTEFAREKAAHLKGDPKNRNFNMYLVAYQEGLNSLSNEIEKLILAFES